MAHGIRISVFLFSLFALLTAFLIWRRIPRPLVFAILYGSAGIYVASYFAGGWVLYALNRDLLDGFVPYLLPIVPAALYVTWTLRRHYKALERERTQV
jgi:hypothetical protein